MRPNREKGQAILLMLVAIGLFLIGGVGLVIDVSQLYTNQQMAQVAADAAAQAAMLGIFQGVDKISSSTISSGYNCTTGTDTYIACQYARLNGFGNDANDTIKVTYPPCSFGTDVCGSVTPNEVQVSITRTVPNTFIRFVGAGTTSTIGATAIAATIKVVTPVPILVIHPTLAASLQGNGGTQLAIQGGPGKSIQVNSSCSPSPSVTCYTDSKHHGTDAYGGGFARIDLSLAGPNYDFINGACTLGKVCGADFGVFGSPASKPAEIYFGSPTNGLYVQPSSPMQDPLLFVNPPNDPAQSPPDPSLTPNPATISVTPSSNPSYGCTDTHWGCDVYSPGTYSSGISVTHKTAIFQPGVYVMQDGQGFTAGAGGTMQMCVVSGHVPTLPPGATWPSPGTGCRLDPNGQTDAGMVVYNDQGGPFTVGANGSAFLQGTPMTDSTGNPSRYAGILLFQDRNAGAATHTVGGGGQLVLFGTLYTTDTTATITSTPSKYQSIEYHGNPSGTSYLVGEIITDALSLKGTSDIRMILTALSFLKVQQVALVGGGPHP